MSAATIKGAQAPEPWTYSTTHNGAFVTVHGEGGATVFLQGDSARAFMDQAERTHERYTDSDLCREYAHIMEGGELC